MANANQSQSKKNFFNPFENMGSMPNFMDFATMRQEFSKNIEAWTAANQVALDLGKESARRAVEIMQKNAQSVYDSSKEAASCKNFSDAQHQQMHMISDIMQNAFSQARESADIFSKATKEILDVCNKRVSEALNECCK
jgi:hypothetical protein